MSARERLRVAPTGLLLALHILSFLLLLVALATSIASHASAAWVTDFVFLSNAGNVEVNFGIWQYCYKVKVSNSAQLVERNVTVSPMEAQCLSMSGTDNDMVVFQALMSIATALILVTSFMTLLSILKTTRLAQKINTVLACALGSCLHVVAVAVFAHQSSQSRFQANVDIVFSGKHDVPSETTTLILTGGRFGVLFVMMCAGMACALLACVLLVLVACRITQGHRSSVVIYEMTDTAGATSAGYA